MSLFKVNVNDCGRQARKKKAYSHDHVIYIHLNLELIMTVIVGKVVKMRVIHSQVYMYSVYFDQFTRKGMKPSGVRRWC